MHRIALRQASRMLALLVLVAACAPPQDAAPPAAAPQYFHHPLQQPRGNTRTIGPRLFYSSLGEYRPMDGPNWLNHAATDVRTPRVVNVYSPDTGRVRFYGSRVQGNRALNAGLPPVKIGRFSFLHFSNAAKLNVDPREIFGRIGGAFNLPPAARGWPVFVVAPNDPIQGAPRPMLGNRQELPGIAMVGGRQVNVFYFNQAAPIGQAKPPDLHVIYYQTEASNYGNRADIRNALSVFDYRNSRPPDFFGLWFVSQNARQNRAKRLIADASGRRAQGNIDIGAAGGVDGGVDLVVGVSSFRRGANNRAGIYRLSYQVHRFLGEEEIEDPPEGAEAGPGGRQMVQVLGPAVMFTYDRMPTVAQDRNLVALQPVYPAGLSTFRAVDGIKRSSYVVTNTGGNDAAFWALQNTQTFPDGDYLLTVTAENIKRAMGMGQAPMLQAAALQRIVKVITQGNLRQLTITR